MPKVSIVIPVYNCEAFLPACIDSLRAQTLSDIEMIFVCDASPDNSLALLRAAEQEDARIRVIAFPENRGVSAARNAGLDAAQGEYIGFCDSDDWVEPQMFEKLVALAEDKDADVTFCRVFKDRASGQENVPLGFATGTRFNAAAIRAALIPAMLSLPKDSDELPLSGYTPRNLFRREAIGDVRFRPDIRYAEDLLFICTCLLQAKAAAALDEAYYHYRFHGGSVTKRYSAFVPDSHDLSNDALEALLADCPACASRMRIRRRKMAVTAVRNYCLPGTPYGLFERAKMAKRYMNREDVRGWFKGVKLKKLPKALAVKLGLVKYRLALVSVLLYSYVFDRV